MAMMRLSEGDFSRYASDPGNDGWLRAMLRLPEERYYTVSVWPVAGMVRLVEGSSRVVKAVKISKSGS
jgi:hypothetical protein